MMIGLAAVIIGTIGAYRMYQLNPEGKLWVIYGLILGIVGAIVGGYVGGLIPGRDLMVTGFNLESVVVAFVGAVVLIAVSRMFTRRRRFGVR